MLEGITGNVLWLACEKCGEKRSELLKQKIHKILEEFGEFENYMCDPCPKCGAVEGYNMNIPVNDTDEEFITGELPEKEEIQRYYVRLLMRLCREDFKSPAI